MNTFFSRQKSDFHLPFKRSGKYFIDNLINLIDMSVSNSPSKRILSKIVMQLPHLIHLKHEVTPTNTEKNTELSCNFLVWMFCRKAQFYANCPKLEIWYFTEVKEHFKRRLQLWKTNECQTKNDREAIMKIKEKQFESPKSCTFDQSCYINKLLYKQSSNIILWKPR